MIRASCPWGFRGLRRTFYSLFFRARRFSPTGRGKRAKLTKLQIWLPTNVSFDQHGEKGTSKLKTRVLEALGLQGWSFSEASGGPLQLPFPSACRGKEILGLSKMLAIAFPLCLSRERQFQGVARKPKSVPFRMILGTSSGFSRSPFPFACRRKGCFRVPRTCSQWPFPPACRGKGNFRAPPGTPQSGWGALETQ